MVATLGVPNLLHPPLSSDQGMPNRSYLDRDPGLRSRFLCTSFSLRQRYYSEARAAAATELQSCLLLRWLCLVSRNSRGCISFADSTRMFHFLAWFEGLSVTVMLHLASWHHFCGMPRSSELRESLGPFKSQLASVSSSNVDKKR